MNGNWTNVAPGEVVKHRKEFIEIDDMSEYKRCRVQLHTKGIVLRDTIQGAVIKTKKQQVCRAGEFLVAEIDAKVGGFGIVPEDLEGAIVSSHYFLIPHIILREIRAFSVPLPRLNEQKEAVKHLDTVLEQLSEAALVRKKTSLELDALLPSIFDRAFKGEL